jgi:5-methylthioribose kinase
MEKLLMDYHILTSDSVKEFIQNIPNIKTYFDDDTLISHEIGDGNLNFVFIVKSQKNPQKALIVKQAVPYLRCVGESFPLSRERMTFEIRALQSYEKLVPNHVPKIYYADEAMSIVVMEFLGNHIIMRKGLIERNYYENFAEHISSFLANTLFYTSSLYLESSQKRLFIDRFNSNTELCKLTEDFVFTFAYMDNETNEIEDNSQDEARELFSNMSFRKNVLKLKYIFMTKSDALLHGDLHTGSIMINKKETYVIDPEFAFFGPFGFDIGALIAKLISAYISHSYTTKDEAYRTWILKTIKEVYEKFEEKFLKLWDEQNESALITKNFIDDATLREFKKEFMQEIFQESIGFAGCKIARRVFGVAGVEEIRGIEDKQIKKEANLKALKTGIKLIENYENIQNIDKLLTIIKEQS